MSLHCFKHFKKDLPKPSKNIWKKKKETTLEIFNMTNKPWWITLLTHCRVLALFFWLRAFWKTFFKFFPVPGPFLLLLVISLKCYSPSSSSRSFLLICSSQFKYSFFKETFWDPWYKLNSTCILSEHLSISS
jgi:hypothetical protein